MTFGEVEFLGPEPEPVPPVRHRSGAASWIAALGWTAATTLAVIAPFQRFYGGGSGLPRRYADYLPGGTGDIGSVNGWGNGAALGPRLGIALVVCAAVCAVLAVAAWTRVLCPFRQHRVFAGASVAAPSLLAGVIGTMALFLGSGPDTAVGWTAYGPGLQFVSPETYSSTISVTFEHSESGHSWCLWLAVAALVCAVVAAVAQSVANRPDPDLAG